MNMKTFNMKNNPDYMFKFLVYLISIYLIIIKNSYYINIVGLIILLSHLYKDITGIKKWPVWCEFAGIILAVILIISAMKISNYYIIIMGIFKFFAHLRQFFFKDYRYYY